MHKVKANWEKSIQIQVIGTKKKKLQLGKYKSTDD